MKSLSSIIAETVAQPKGGDEKRFKAQHEIEVIDHPTHDPRQQIANIVKKKRLADNDNKSDVAAYDKAYEKDEDDYEEDDTAAAGSTTGIPMTHKNFTTEAVIAEAEMTDAQMKKRDEIVKSMEDKKADFKSRYGDKWKEVMYATATKQAMKEEVELSEDVIADLQKIVSSKQASSVKFADGGKLKVDMTTAGALVKVHSALNDANKKKFADALNKNENMFMKMVDFAFSKVK